MPRWMLWRLSTDGSCRQSIAAVAPPDVPAVAQNELANPKISFAAERFLSFFAFHTTACRARGSQSPPASAAAVLAVRPRADR